MDGVCVETHGEVVYITSGLAETLARGRDEGTFPRVEDSRNSHSEHLPTLRCAQIHSIKTWNAQKKKMLVLPHK